MFTFKNVYSPGTGKLEHPEGSCWMSWDRWRLFSWPQHTLSQSFGSTTVPPTWIAHSVFQTPWDSRSQRPEARTPWWRKHQLGSRRQNHLRQGSFLFFPTIMITIIYHHPHVANQCISSLNWKYLIIFQKSSEVEITFDDKSGTFDDTLGWNEMFESWPDLWLVAHLSSEQQRMHLKSRWTLCRLSSGCPWCQCPRSPQFGSRLEDQTWSSPEEYW